MDAAKKVSTITVYKGYKAYKAGMMERGVRSVRPKASGDTRAGQMNLTKRNERSTKCDAPRAGKHADTISCSFAQMARNTLWRGTASGSEQRQQLKKESEVVPVQW
jgi:hypothetical protein